MDDLRRSARRVGVCLGLLLTVYGGGCGLTNPIPPGPSVALELVASLPSASGSPIQLVGVPDGSGRSFVLGQAGFVHVLSGGVLATTPLLDMDDRGIDLTSDFEGGALELVFHPNFAGLDGPSGAGLFYTYTHEDVDGAADFDHPELAAVAGDGQTVLREWRMGGDGFDTVLAGSRVLLRIDQPQDNHNGGGLAFDAAGLLYVGVGDGGGSNDNSGGVNAASDGHTNGGGGNGQDRSNVFGSILRIDPLGSDSNNGQYGIPENPYVDNENGWLEEIYAWGMRNPYRLHVDALGQPWVADVGQGQREEIGVASWGGNHGWPYLEGTRVNRAGGPAGTVAPLGEYTHADGTAVLGGWVYDGAAIPALQGRYVFGDFRDNGLAQLYSMDTVTGAISEFVLLAGSAALPAQAALYGVGRDGAGEIYYLVRPFPSGGNGSIFRLVAAPGDQDGDGVGDASDLCPGHPDAGQADTDGDDVGDACDVCTEAPDPSQRDRDLDGIGNACDCDFDQDGDCDIADFDLFLADFIATEDSGIGSDMNDDGTVDIGDFDPFLGGFVAGEPGPSGLAP